MTVREGKALIDWVLKKTREEEDFFKSEKKQLNLPPLTDKRARESQSVEIIRCLRESTFTNKEKTGGEQTSNQQSLLNLLQ